jgi:Xaa-Pro aminopeptidase
MKSVQERIHELKSWLAKQQYDAIIIPSNDPHFSEYVADHWKSREFISGFTGSMGTAVVTSAQMALWTDSRYHIQAENQLKGTDYQLQRVPLPETPDIESWLCSVLEKGRVAIDGKLFSVNEYQRLKKALGALELCVADDPFNEIWTERPAIPHSASFLLDVKYSGESADSKIKRVKEKLDTQASGIYLMAALDDIAWLLNLRGSDISYNPLTVAYAAMDDHTVHLFIGKGKLSEKDTQTLQQSGITLHDYTAFDDYLMTLKSKKVVYNGDRFDIFHYHLLEKAGAALEAELIPAGSVNHLKSIKNEIEIEGFRKAMIADGIALTRFHIWLENRLAKGKTTSETEVVEKLNEYRSQQNGFMGISFSPIVGYRANAAMPHYSPTPEKSVTVENKGFLLMDSGGQYLFGTTDITRTLHLSEPTEQEKTDYTLTLMGMINLSMIIWPEGLQGLHLDILARAPMLSHRINYLHGTGHGVGHFLNVHEGPHTVRMNANTVPLEAGMTLSNEPALYRAGQYGIRNENLMVVQKDETNEYGKFLRFETLTLCCIDTKPINKTLMAVPQIQWLNEYHKKVFRSLSPYLNSDEAAWLRHKTKEI